MSGVSLDIWDEPKENMVATNPPRDAYMVPRGVPNVQVPQVRPQQVPQIRPQQVPYEQVRNEQVPHEQVPRVRNEQTQIPHVISVQNQVPHVRSENIPSHAFNQMRNENVDVKKPKKKFFDFSNSMLYKICVVFSMILLLIIVFQLNRLNNILSSKK